jgi:hypothetical protein
MHITQYESFLSEELFLEVQKFVKGLITDNEKPLSTSFGNWQKELINASTPILIYEFKSDEIDLLQKIKKEVEIKIPYKVSSIMVHMMPKLSYIPWHDDSHVKAALSLYLNETWDTNWGGIFMYKPDKDIRAVEPKRNLGVFQYSGIQHCVTTVNMDAEYRYSLQFFLEKEKQII